jgi:hypothetical protein
METPKVSVIIPCYKAGKYIGKCIDMIQSQSYKNLEIIVIIDGKTDNSEAIARSYKDVKVITFTQNKGQSVGRNSGIDVATGKYIHFMDVDDRINRDFYSNSIKVAEKTGAEITCCGMYNEKWKEQSQIFEKILIKTEIRSKLKLSWAAQWGYSCRYLFNLDFIKRTQIRYEEGRIIEDLPFTFKLIYYCNKIVTAPNTLYYYNYTPTSSTNSTSEEIIRKRTEDLKHAVDVIKNFAKEKQISMPGRSYDLDKFCYLIRKYFVRYFTQRQIKKSVDRIMNES